MKKNKQKGKEEEKEEPLYKRYRDWDAGPEDRTSHEEQVVRKKLSAPSMIPIATTTSAVAPPPPPTIDWQSLLDQHLENSILFLLFVYNFTLPKLDLAPPDANKDTPIQMRDKRLLQQGKASYEILGPLIGHAKEPLAALVAQHLTGCHERIQTLHASLLTEKRWSGQFVQRYVSQTPPLVDCITGKPIAVDSGYVLLLSGLVVSRDDYVYLSALHVVYHFWDYVMWVFQEQEQRDQQQQQQQQPFDNKSIYSLWNRWWAPTTTDGGNLWKYIGAPPLRQRIIQLRAMFLSALQQ